VAVCKASQAQDGGKMVYRDSIYEERRVGKDLES
jgi:hypothetical protein